MRTSYSPNLFYHEYTLANTTGGRMTALAKLCALAGVSPGVDTEIRVSRPSRWGGNRDEHRINFDVNIKQLSPSARWRLKKFVKLEVPSYALGGTYKEPPLMGLLTLFADPQAVSDDYLRDIITLDFTVNGSYICEKVGTQEKEPSEWQQKRAKELAAMSDEDILSKHRADVLEMLTPKIVDSFECRSAVEDND